MQPPLIAANWKMHGDRPRLEGWVAMLAEHLPGGGSHPAAPIRAAAPSADSGPPFAWGGQTLATEGEGAYTGEVSAEMLAECGCGYVLVGHSERRRLWGEDDAAIAGQFCRALDAGLQPILCLGESREERDAGETFATVERQLKAVLENLGKRRIARG